MHVVHLSKVKGIAGSEGHLLTLLPELARRVVDITMVVLEEPGHPVTSFCEALEAHSVAVIRLPIYAHVDPGLVYRLARKFRELKPDLVHTHLLHADLYGLHAARFVSGLRAISSRHGDNPFRRKPFIIVLNRRALRYAARVIAISHALSRFMIEVVHINHAKSGRFTMDSIHRLTRVMLPI